MSSTPLFFEDVEVGDRIPEWSRTTGIENWNRYAAVNDEFVGIHMDDEVGRAAGNAQGAFGMGNLRWAYLLNALRAWAGEEAGIRSLEVQYRAINQKNETLTCVATVRAKSVEGGEHLVHLDVDVLNPEGKGTTPGRAVLVLPSRAGG
jgi:acyl dehydratase